MKTIKNKYLDFFFRVILVLCATFVMALAFSIFFVPHNIVPGGFGGLAMVITSALSLVNIEISNGIVSLLLNVPLYIYAIRLLGSRFGALSVVGVIGYSVSIDLVDRYLYPLVASEPTLGDPLLCSIFGGVLIGVGLGIVIRVGGSTGGTDMLSYVIFNKHPQLKISMLVVVIDLVVVLLSITLNGPFVALYALVVIFVQGKALDIVAEGYKAAKSYFIISDKSDEIAKAVMSKVNRGITALSSRGMYTGKQKDMLMCICLRTQATELKKTVSGIDPNAFMFAVPVQEVLGKGFVKHNEPKNKVAGKVFRKKKKNGEEQ